MASAHDLDLPNRHLIEPRLDKRPDGAEEIWGVDDVEFTHALRVVVLPDRARLCDVVLHLVEGPEGDVVQVEDSADGFDWVSDLCGGSRETFCEEPFILENESLQETLFRCQRIQLGNVQFPENFNVYRTSFLDAG